jgi:phosphopantothenoylcysteine synthetase/decarboxylase
VSILGVVVCGAPLAGRTNDLFEHARQAGWDVSLTATDAASAWLGTDQLEASDAVRKPGELKRRRPDALLVCPLTFNSGSKWALGIADNRPMSLMCESLGAGIPIVAVPMVNESLWQHPSWAGHLKVLGDSGVVFVDPATGRTAAVPLASGTGDRVAAEFGISSVIDLLSTLRSRTS